VAVALRIPIAHIEGGEVSEGAIDDAIRNALTKLSHVHFTPTEAARRRVIAMGEEEWRVHRVGAPSLDHLRRRVLPSAPDLEARLGLGPERPRLLVAYHPVTLARDTLAEADAVFDALGHLPHSIAFCFPNADAGSRELISRARAFCAARTATQLFVNLNPVDYWALLQSADVMVGNSSSGIMETPALRVPTVNIGRRQQGRERARNILDVDGEAGAIVRAVERALSSAFRVSLAGMENPYGDGQAAERIADVLCRLPLDERLLIKRARPVD
jgi:UDP-N-acetylglucosamine 2-epimerase (non-hydrolysing)/GDP/UDP-N,N'-diacetylbacillosamine 2-epimerase (hydrolysing)